MNTDTQLEDPKDQLPEAAGEIARRAADAAKETARKTADAAKETAQKATVAAKGVTGEVEDWAGEVIDATKDAARSATGAAKDVYQTAARKAEGALATSKEYVRRNPVGVVLGAIAFGATIGCMLATARRKPTFSERYADEPMAAVREAILDALAPMTQRVHKGYDSARDGAGKVVDRVQSLGSGGNGNSFSDQIGRIGHNLKFW